MFSDLPLLHRTQARVKYLIPSPARRLPRSCPQTLALRARPGCTVSVADTVLAEEAVQAVLTLALMDVAKTGYATMETFQGLPQNEAAFSVRQPVFPLANPRAFPRTARMHAWKGIGRFPLFHFMEEKLPAAVGFGSGFSGNTLQVHNGEHLKYSIIFLLYLYC